MKKQIALFTIVAAALIAVPAITRAEDASTNAPSATTPKKHAGSGFHGKVAAVDATAMTVTVGTQTYTVTSDTKITKDNQPATFADITVGTMISGGYKTDASGTMTATKITIGGGKGGKTKSE